MFVCVCIINKFPNVVGVWVVEAQNKKKRVKDCVSYYRKSLL